jgi:hypothetical protein
MWGALVPGSVAGRVLWVGSWLLRNYLYMSNLHMPIAGRGARSGGLRPGTWNPAVPAANKI